MAELRGIRIGWRFISLYYINVDRDDVSESYLAAAERGRRYLRICAAARQRFGNDAVGALYRAWGERYWYTTHEGGFEARFLAAAEAVDITEILASLDLPTDLADAADDESWDTVLRAESHEAFERTGPDVGTPILTYDPPNGNSLFGPVVSAVPDDNQALAFYYALRVFADFPAFSELKRTKRAPLLS